MSKVQDPSVFNLKALLDATKFVDKQLNQAVDDIISINLNELHPLQTNSFIKLDELLKEVDQICSLGKSQQPVRASDLKNVSIAYEIIEQLLNQKSGSQYQRSELFYPPVSPEIAPTYYNVIKFPMCFIFVKLRLLQNLQKGQDFVIQQFSRETLLTKPEYSKYGSIFQQRNDILKENVKNMRNEIIKQISRKLDKNPQPYSTIEELVVDMVMIATNCVYFNAMNVENIKTAGENLFGDIINTIPEKFGIDLPYWITNCLQELKITYENIMQNNNM